MAGDGKGRQTLFRAPAVLIRPARERYQRRSSRMRLRLVEPAQLCKICRILLKVGRLAHATYGMSTMPRLLNARHRPFPHYDYVNAEEARVRRCSKRPLRRRVPGSLPRPFRPSSGGRSSRSRSRSSGRNRRISLRRRAPATSGDQPTPARRR